MVSLQATATTTSLSSPEGSSNPSKKRKRGALEEEPQLTPVKALDFSRGKKHDYCPSTQTTPPAHFNVDLHLQDPPLPPEWQRYLDIKSGVVHYYNTRTGTKTSRDPRTGIDLELHLCCESPVAQVMMDRDNGGRKEEKPDQVCGEMIATVCMRCHMPVIICKSSPACPNCKFLQRSADRGTSTPSSKTPETS